MTRTYVEIHALQTLPPSNVNRDDTGSPKTAIYGGTRRARVSSQAWKRAMRTAFGDILDPRELGVRTKRVVDLVKKAIVELDAALESEAEKLAEGVLKAAGITISAAKKSAKEESDRAGEAGYLLFLSRRQIENLAAFAIEANAAGAVPDKKAAKAAADSGHSVDLALFGRMVADAPDLTVDATAQVAHAISVHAVENEFDYYTAVDDQKTRDEDAGAGMIGTVEFNSSTLYRYATVSAHGLRDALGDDSATSRAVAAFVRAFVTSMPTGKQNTFANRTLPDAVVVTIRADQPINLVGAFEQAVTATDARGRLSEASARLAQYAADVERAYGKPAEASFVMRVGAPTEPLAGLGEELSLDDLIDRVGAVVGERIGR